MSVILNFTAQGCRLSVCDNYYIAEGAQNLIQAQFSIDSTWDDLTLYARFRQGDEPNGKPSAYDVSVDSDTKTCAIPHEVLQSDSFFVMLWGENAAGDRLTTQALQVRVKESINGDAGEPDVPTPSVLQQIMDLLESGGVTAKAGGALNLAPMFSIPFDNSSYWADINTSHIARKSEGWATVTCDNSASSTPVYINFFDAKSYLDSVLATDTNYTVMVEIRNANITGSCNLYIPSTQSNSQSSIFSAGFPVTVDSSMSDYTKLTGDLTTASDFSSFTYGMRGFIMVGANANVTFDFRVSLYQADYSGDYVPPVLLYEQNGVIYDDLIADGQVTTAKLANGAVTTAKLADASVTPGKLESSAVTTAKIADDAVTSAKIADGAVLGVALADGSVTNAKLADGSVGSGELIASSVITGKIADGNVTSAKIANSAVSTAKLADDAVTSAKIADGAVTGAEIADLSITSAKIADGAVTDIKITDGSVTSEKIASLAVATGNIANYAVTGAKMADKTITNGKIADSCITNKKLAASAGLIAYPVGAVYISYKSTSPATLFGGTWVEIKGVFPYFNASTATGGSNTQTLTVANLPSHTHTTSLAWADNSGSTEGHITAWGVYKSTSAMVSTNATGSGTAHNNMPAYQSFYAWHRTA